MVKRHAPRSHLPTKTARERVPAFPPVGSRNGASHRFVFENGRFICRQSPSTLCNRAVAVRGSFSLCYDCCRYGYRCLPVSGDVVVIVRSMLLDGTVVAIIGAVAAEWSILYQSVQEPAPMTRAVILHSERRCVVRRNSINCSVLIASARGCKRSSTRRSE